MHDKPLVSIIMPLYNAQTYVSMALDSILAQTYTNWELILVDDASVDKSKEVVKPYLKDRRIKFFSNMVNIGAAQTRNVALKEASGDYIAFLDSDDIWLSQKLEKQLRFMQTQQVLCSYSSYDVIDSCGKVISKYSAPSKVTYHSMLKSSSIGTLTMMYNVKELGKFYFILVGHEDYIMKLHILKNIEFAKGIQEPLAKYRIVRDSLSSNKIKAAKWQWHIYRNIEKLSLFKSMYYFIYYTYNGFTKYKKI